MNVYPMLARYNEWANTRLYASTGKLPVADFRAERGAFFGSLHGTLNHLLVADRIWMQRFTRDGPTYSRLDLILHDDLEELRQARESEDRRIVAWVESLSENDLAGRFTYRTIVNPRETTQPLAPALAHFFNHQTHHRGQAHAILTAIAGRSAAPALDLIYFQRETGIGIDA